MAELLRRPWAIAVVAIGLLAMSAIEYGLRNEAGALRAPLVAFGGLIGLGLALGVAVGLGRSVEGARGAIVLALLCVVPGLALRPLGFPLTLALLVIGWRQGMGSRRLWLDLLFGFGGAALAYLVLAKGLGVPLAVGTLMKAFYPA